MVTQIVVMASAIRGKCVAQVKMNVVLLASGQAAALPIDVPVRNPLDTIPIQVHYLILVVAMELVMILPNIVARGRAVAVYLFCVRGMKYVARLVNGAVIHIHVTTTWKGWRSVVLKQTRLIRPIKRAVVRISLVTQYVQSLTMTQMTYHVAATITQKPIAPENRFVVVISVAALMFWGVANISRIMIRASGTMNVVVVD